MKKTAAFLGALLIAFSAVSCGKKGESSSEAESIVQAELVSFKSADINMGDDFKELINTDKRGVFCLIFGKNENGEYCGCMTSPEFQEKKSFTLSADDGEARYAAIMTGGKVAVLAVVGSHTYIYTYTKELERENTYDLGELLDTDMRFGELLCADDGFYINVDRSELAYVDKEGNLKGDVPVGGRFITGIVNDCDGTPCALLTEGIDTTLVTLSGGAVVDELKCGELADFANALCRGEGDYRIAAVITTGLYGLKDGKWVQLSDFTESDFRTTDIWDMEMCSDGEMFVMLRKNDGSCEMRYLSQRDISEIRQKKVITMAKTYGTNEDPYTDLIKRFNADNDEYKIEIVDYFVDSPDTYIDPYEQLSLDIVSGNCPDIVVFTATMPVESFGSRESIFVDLYDYMDKDEDIHREDFLDGFLEGLETNGKLLKLSPSFTVSTYMIKDKFAGGLTSWDYDDFEQVLKNMPEGMLVSEECILHERAQMFRNIGGYSQFIDVENGTCSFDSPEFIRAIKLFNDYKIGLTQKDYNPHSLGGVSELNDFLNDNTLLYKPHILCLRHIRESMQVYSNEPFTYIGFVGNERLTATAGPSFSYGIMANSPYKDGAWDFLKHYMFSEESTFEPGFSGIPALKKYYERDKEELSTPVSYIDPETGEETDKEYYYFYPDPMGSPVKIEEHPFTEEESQRCDELVHTALMNMGGGSGVNIWNILYEELTAYYEGEKTAEQAAEIIQNRVSLYLGERY